MAITAQVKCINKTPRQDPHDRIQNIGGTNADGTRWKRSQPNAITDIESGEYKYHVSVGGQSVWVIVASHLGNKYIKTANDGLHPNNLLSLPECP
jgi:Protein of unknown function (DUF3892)